MTNKEMQTLNRATMKYVKSNITINLSPQNNCVWGDYARTIIIQQGKVVPDIDNIQNDEWKNGLLMEDFLHKTLVEIAKPDMIFEDLYFYINKLIVENNAIKLSN